MELSSTVFWLFFCSKKGHWDGGIHLSRIGELTPDLPFSMFTGRPYVRDKVCQEFKTMGKDDFRAM